MKKSVSNLFETSLNEEGVLGFSIYHEEDDDFVDEDDFEGSFVIRGQFMLDGADTLEEAAEMIRAYAEMLDDLRIKGYELETTIENDYGFAQLVR